MTRSISHSWWLRTYSIQCFVGNNRCNKGYFERKALSGNSFQIFQQRCWFPQLRAFYKTYKYQSASYLYNVIPPETSMYITRSANNIPCFHFKHNFFKNFLFLFVIIEWDNLQVFGNSEFNYSKSILQFIRIFSSSTYNCFKSKGIK